MLGEPALLWFDVPAAGDASATHRVAAYRWGKSTACTALCIHGLTRNGRDFDYLAQALAADCSVITIDMPGRGKSEWLKDPSGYTNTTYLGDIKFILDKLGITQLDWIGTSMGGILGMMAANAFPGLIKALVLNDIGCVIPASGLQRIKDIADMKTTFSSRTDAEAAFRLRTATFGIVDESHWQHLFQYGIEENGGRFRFTYDPAIFQAGFSKDTPTADLELWPMWEAVTKIPTLLIRGMQSDLLTHATALEMQKRHPDLILKEIENTGHAPALMADNQTSFIRDWLKQKH